MANNGPSSGAQEQLRRTERKNRDAFRKMMEEHIADGTLTAKTHWRDYCQKVKESEAYEAVATNTSGSTPKDLFEDVTEELDKKYDEDKSKIKDVLKQDKIIISSTMTFDDFKSSIKESMNPTLISDINLQLVYEDLIDRAKKKEEKEAKKRKRLAKDFTDDFIDSEVKHQDKENVISIETAPIERNKSKKKHKNEQENMKDAELMENAPSAKNKSKKKHKNGSSSAKQGNSVDDEINTPSNNRIRNKSKKKSCVVDDSNACSDKKIEHAKKREKKKRKVAENGAELMENAPSEKNKSKKKHKNGSSAKQGNSVDDEINAPSDNRVKRNKSKKKSCVVDDSNACSDKEIEHAKKREKKKRKVAENGAELMENAPSEKNKSKNKYKNGSSSAKLGNSVDDEINAPSDNRVKRNKSKKKSCVVDDNNACSDKEIEHAKKREKKKRKVAENGAATPNKSNKKVKFSDKDEIFTLPADSNIGSDKEDNLVRGKRFTKEEDEVLKQAVFHYIAKHNLGEEEGLDMVLNSKKHKMFKGCWREIGSQIPYRPYTACYYRAQVLFRRSKTRKWTQEEYDMILKHQAEHGNKWKDLAEELGKHRWHVKDTWRRIQLRNAKKGHWSQKEYQKLFDLVNKDLQAKVFEEKHSKHGMLRDNIPWTAISEEVSTRNQASCCMKWYDQLTSRMVAEGVWADVDDYVLISELYSLDANCIEDVDWDSILENRDGDLCRKRWNQMALHIGHHGNKSFSEQVEILAQRYCPHLLEAREAWDNKPRVP